MTVIGTNCPICDSNATRAYRTDVQDFEYGVVPTKEMLVRRCSECDSEFLFPRPSEEDLDAFYPEDYHAYHDDHGWVARSLVKLRGRGRARFYASLISGGRGRLFDVGVGDCRHFDAIREFCDIECCGVEIKKDIAERATAKGYDVVHGTLEGMDIARHVGRYDVVSMNHVLEHVVQPRVMLERAFRLLKPGGTVLGQLPTNTCWEAALFGRYWAGYHYPRHLQAFSKRGLRDLLTGVGFNSVEVVTAPHLQSALSLQNSLIGQGWRPTMKFGKSPVYSLFLLAVAPFELLAYLAGRGGIVDFKAVR